MWFAYSGAKRLAGQAIYSTMVNGYSKKKPRQLGAAGAF
jgi:hypothetical protein